MFLSSYLLYFFIRRLISEVSGPIVAKLCHMFGGYCNFLNWVKNLGGPSPKKFGGPKTSKFRNLRFDREYLRTGTRYRRSKNGIGNCNHSPTCTPNLVNFGPQTAKNRRLISTHSIDFFGHSYLSSRDWWRHGATGVRIARNSIRTVWPRFRYTAKNGTAHISGALPPKNFTVGRG